MARHPSRRAEAAISVIVAIIAAGLLLVLGAWTKQGPPTSLADAQQRWKDSGISEYLMDVEVTGCFGPCPIEYSVTVVDGKVTHSVTVVDGIVTQQSANSGSDPMTVERLFQQISGFGPDALEATYDDYGVPIEADVNPTISDGQADYTVTFTPGTG